VFEMADFPIVDAPKIDDVCDAVGFELFYVVPGPYRATERQTLAYKKRFHSSVFLPQLHPA
jgi:hypothetical protein